MARESIGIDGDGGTSERLGKVYPLCHWISARRGLVQCLEVIRWELRSISFQWYLMLMQLTCSLDSHSSVFAFGGRYGVWLLIYRLCGWKLVHIIKSRIQSYANRISMSVTDFLSLTLFTPLAEQHCRSVIYFFSNATAYKIRSATWNTRTKFNQNQWSTCDTENGKITMFRYACMWVKNRIALCVSGLFKISP